MTVTEKAYAKVNLFLDVTGCRDDGFHEISSVMHSVSLCDVLTVEAYHSDSTSISVLVNDSSLPTDEKNLVYMSAAKYLSYFNENARVLIRLEKHIPVGAGLGGGSADAAATLRAMNKIFGFATETELYTISSQIGSDVPFCLCGGLAHCRGRGERIEILDQSPKMIFVISIGSERVSTPVAYERLDCMYNNFENYNSTLDANILFGKNNSLDPNSLYNIFESITDIDDISKIKDIMRNNSAEAAMMSGSGPAVFGIFNNMDSAIMARNFLLEAGYTAYIAESVYFNGE
ncbi:MAG: 4-(cytidine 5'-diphospho)-2-C-methyl-D-erythritol kinase [Clostridia bacterium]|nr:4-(cytidine 5'-diphospho)-2-C-methyl-D-erythritol kinase [Clostridia bacterium]